MINKELTVVSGTQARNILEHNRKHILSIIESAYKYHYAKDSVNPNSYFLKFPEKPQSRIIALPAYLGGDVNLAGIKWIASFPQNIERNLQRASALLVLNDYDTGYPIAVLESARISAHRTSASAALAAKALSPSSSLMGRIAIVGAGFISRTILEYLHTDGWRPSSIVIFDLRKEDAERLAYWAQALFGCDVNVSSSANDASQHAELIVLATTASTPYLNDETILTHNPTILNVSLRDISPSLIVQSQNILDDIEHCLKENTSPHLTEQETGNRDFVDGVLAQVLDGTVPPDTSRARIFSPFGLGILDIAVGKFVLDIAKEAEDSMHIGEFFSEVDRW